MAKIGIMGGTFNPIHHGHLQIAHMAVARAGLREAIFIPTGHPPHKPEHELAPPLDRLNMTALAIEGIPRFSLSTLEVDRAGPTYSVDTLMELGARYPSDTFSFIIGGDTLEAIHLWHDVDALHKYCDLIVAPRPTDHPDDLCTLAARVSESLSIGILLLDRFGPDVSSTQMRAFAAFGGEESQLSSVSDYIGAQGLYGAPDSAMAASLRADLSPKRFRHTRETARAAVRLAIAHGVSPSKAHIAGLLHDCAKGETDEAMLSIIERSEFSLDEEELRLPWLWHAAASAALAHEKYHVDDPEILSAIRWHNIGRTGMTALDKVIYIADGIEPNRTTSPELDEIRSLAFTDLDAAFLSVARRTLHYLGGRGYEIHPNTKKLANKTTEGSYA